MDVVKDRRGLLPYRDTSDAVGDRSEDPEADVPPGPEDVEPVRGASTSYIDRVSRPEADIGTVEEEVSKVERDVGLVL